MVIIPNFRPKPGHLNDRVYCKPIDRTLKMLFSERSDSFLRPTIVVEVSGFWIKKNKYKMILKIFFLKKQRFPQSLESIQKHSSKYMAADQ